MLWKHLCHSYNLRGHEALFLARIPCLPKGKGEGTEFTLALFVLFSSGPQRKA